MAGRRFLVGVSEMLQADKFSNLINTIYDAALDPALWSVALEKAAGFVGGSGAELIVRDTLGDNILVRSSFGISPDGTDGLGYGPLQTLAGLTVGVVTSSKLMMSHSEYARTRFYKEWAQGRGVVDTILTVLEKSPTIEAAFTVFCHENDGQADDESRRNMQLIAPHLRRALLMGRSMELKTAEAASLAEALDSLSAAMFLVDGEGRLTHANASGERLLSVGDLLRQRSGRLVASDPASDHAFRKILVSAATGAEEAGGRGVSIPLCARTGDHYVAHVLPLPLCSRRRTGGRQGAVAALFVHKATLETRSPSSVIAKIFKLTPSELRVLLAIVQVGGVPETAEALGVAETTVKTHLQRLFGKTGTARQAELVKVVASFANPLIA
jgi:DNA-binding CsgD family transcriptional regulator/PAS domain-containing protein